MTMIIMVGIALLNYLDRYTVAGLQLGCRKNRR